MATRYWVARSASVAQVTKVVFSSIVATNTYSVTINGKTVSYVALTTSLVDLVAGLVAAWGVSAEPEHQEMVAAERDDPTISGLQLTAVTAGNPITVTASATTGTATVTTPTVASGPNFWNLAANWDGGTLPAAADNLVVSGSYSTVDILHGLTDVNNYASITIEASYTGQVGLPATNVNKYPEYRTQNLTLGTGTASIADIGYGEGNYPKLVNISFEGSSTDLTVHGSSSNNQTGTNYPVNIFGTASGSVINVYGGSVLIDSATTSAATSLNVLERPGGSRPKVKVSNKVTIATITCEGGETLVEATCTTLVARSTAIVTVAKAAAAGTVKVASRSTIDWNTRGGITTLLEVEPAGVINFGKVGTTKTVAAAKLHSTGEIHDPLAKVTWTAGIVLQGCRLTDVVLDKGVGVTV